MHMHVTRLELTRTGLQALEPRVIDVSVTGTSAILEPSTAGSATTVSAGFLERATLRTRQFRHNR